MEETFYKDLLIELECPICTSYMVPPIRQCATGHSVCESCRNKLQKCALCQSNFTDSRNISLEGLAVKMRYPCVYKASGCTASLAYNEREGHKLNCRYRGFACAMEKCSWVGPLEELAAHWASKKMTSRPYHMSNLCHTKMKNEAYYVNIVEAYNKMFWFKCRLSNKKLYWAVQYIGNVGEADEYFYEIEIFKPGRTKRKVLMSDYCQPIDIPNAHLLKEDGCIWMNTELVEDFVNEDHLLVYYMRVHQVGPKSATKKDDASASACDRMVKKHRDRSKGPPSNPRMKEFKPKKKTKDQSNEGFVLVDVERRCDNN
ncbi:unnamed protein product [Callosobruchus maculatus]|uniref:E3 ubiquitin-protein ligase n=1 Tax=Callosobruchus maculatus TaxID=64391 RepID=A0A653BY40_CALMS|nr:unnamed protein product [Callosobruchus maculatus]